MNFSFGLLFCVLFFFSPCVAQVSIRGRVTSEDRALGSVRIELRAEESSRILAYTFSNAEGKYLLKSGGQANLYLSFRALTYEPISKKIQDLKSDTIINVQLVPGAVERLEEVFVHTKRPHRRGRDTIELSVNSFLQGDERTVEDLLRKIPGINVGTDGSIKIGNKEVEKVMVEGDDFFEKGYRLLTQSMSVQPLEKVQVLQRYSNNKHLKGIENSDKVALNLQLKADSKNQWMGSVSAQGAPIGPKYYQVGANVMNFGKKNKYYLLGTANNNGVDAVSGIHHVINSGSADEPGQIGVGVATPTLIDNTPDLPGFNYRRTNFNQDRLLSLNTILNPAPKLKIKWMGFINPTKKSFYRNTVQEYNMEDIQFTNNESYHFTKKIDTYFSKWEFQYDLNKGSSLSYIGTLGSLGRNDLGNLILNDIGSQELSKMRGYLTNHTMTYTTKLSGHEALVSSVRWISQQSPLEYSIDKYYYEDLFGSGSISGVSQRLENGLNYLGATSHYLARRKKGDMFEIAMVSEYKKQHLLTDLVLEGEGGGQNRPAGFSNDMDLASFNMDFISKYTIKRRPWEITPRVNASFVSSKLNSATEQASRNNWLISPGLSGKWTIYAKGKLEADFSFQQRNTTATEVFSNYYTTGLRNFTKGLGDMATLSSTGGAFTYTHGSMLDKFFANFSVGQNMMYDYIGSENVLKPNFNLVGQVLLKDKKTTFYKAELNYFLKFLNGNVRLDLGANYSAYETAVSGLGRRSIHTEAYDCSVSFRSVWKSPLNIYGGYNWQQSIYFSEDKNKVHNGRGFLDISMDMGGDWQCSLKNESYSFGSFLGESSKAYYFSDFFLSYDWKKKKTRFDITAKNLLNTRHFRNAVLTDIYRATTQYRLLPCYIAFGIDYTF
ncbi:MAG: hypothetical protein LBF27_34105 [Sphingobacterium sp.]|jgi:hypothetical protein|nr:hypothetical protein [Sphingobacterium sp.]